MGPISLKTGVHRSVDSIQDAPGHFTGSRWACMRRGVRRLPTGQGLSQNFQFTLLLRQHGRSCRTSMMSTRGWTCRPTGVGVRGRMRHPVGFAALSASAARVASGATSHHHPRVGVTAQQLIRHSVVRAATCNGAEASGLRSTLDDERAVVGVASQSCTDSSRRVLAMGDTL